jgi:hypothetical protein
MIATTRMASCTDSIRTQLLAERTVAAQLGAKLVRHTDLDFREIGG